MHRSSILKILRVKWRNLTPRFALLLCLVISEDVIINSSPKWKPNPQQHLSCKKTLKLNYPRHFPLYPHYDSSNKKQQTSLFSTSAKMWTWSKLFWQTLYQIHFKVASVIFILNFVFNYLHTLFWTQECGIRSFVGSIPTRGYELFSHSCNNIKRGVLKTILK